MRSSVSRSPILRSASFMAACLLSLSGCSAVKAVLEGTPSPSPSHAHQSAADQEGDIRDYDDELTDNDEEDNRAQAEAQITKVVPGSDQVDVTADALSADRVVKVSAGARDVTITATNLVVIIEGEIESLTVQGFDNTIWIDAAHKVTFGSNDGDNLNYVFWHSGPPQSKVDPQGLNVIGKDVHAPVIRSCSALS